MYKTLRIVAVEEEAPIAGDTSQEPMANYQWPIVYFKCFNISLNAGFRLAQQFIDHHLCRRKDRAGGLHAVQAELPVSSVRELTASAAT